MIPSTKDFLIRWEERQNRTQSQVAFALLLLQMIPLFVRVYTLHRLHIFSDLNKPLRAVPLSSIVCYQDNFPYQPRAVQGQSQYRY